jgi:hypothetical protein
MPLRHYCEIRPVIRSRPIPVIQLVIHSVINSGDPIRDRFHGIDRE